MKIINNTLIFMRKGLSRIGAGLAFSIAAVFSGAAAEPGTVALHGHVPAIVSQLQAKGRLPAETDLDLAIGLPLRNRAELTNLLQQVYDPASPNYRHYLTPGLFTAQFGPTEQDYQKVIDFARQNGLTVTGTHPNRMLLDVRGKASDVERAFHVTLRTYRHPAENRDFFAPDTEPVVPSTMPIQDIGGLDNFREPHSHYKIKSVVNTTKSSGVPPTALSPGATTGSGPFGNYVGDDFRHAYVPGTLLNGSGQTIALVEFDGYFTGDINEYENRFGRTNVPLQNVLIDGFGGAPTGNGGEVEVSLDIEMVISIAPALANVVVYEGDPNNFHPNDVLNRIATDDSAQQVSSSWTWTGGPETTTDQIFQQMALQGQTYFQCSSDFDAYPAGLVDDPFFFGTPADNPYVTCVGGTTLRMHGAGVSYNSETVWNWDVRYGTNYDGEGSSGGISSYYSIPSWQTNVNMTVPGGSSTARNFPDVALTADDTLVIADGGLEYIGVGGTSIATPLWAGFTALVNQQSAGSGHASVGFLNPAIYAIANNAVSYTNCFHDITTGNNEWSSSPNLFSAVAGYDLCTGLGTPKGTNLINALVSSAGSFQVRIATPAPPYGSTMSVLKSGNPNGTWSLFVIDDHLLYDGVISNGWLLTLTTASPVGYAADLAVSMAVAPATVPVGGNAVYVIGLTNYGPSASSNAIVQDTLPSGLTFVSSSLTQGSLIRSGLLLVWDVGNLATNAGAQLTLTLQANSAGSIDNSATATADTSDPNPDDNSATATINAVNVTQPQFGSNFTSTNGTFSLTITGASVSTILQASTNLVNWINVYTGTPPFTFTDPGASNYPDRFYRALLGP